MGRIAKPVSMTRQHRAAVESEKDNPSLHDLELRHQKNASEFDLLVKDEDARRLRLRIMSLRDENSALRDQVDLNNSANTKLITRCDNLSAQIEAKIALIRSQEEQLRKQEREYSNLKAELQTMNDIHENSANVLSEKLALSRELANLKPEIEHLRSQVNHQQTVLSEKLALERQVNTLEVELENEKKATKRAMKNRESTDRVEDELRKQLRETEKQLTAETTERERLEDQLEQRMRAHAIALQDQDSTRELEADLRKKLQEAQRQLREERAEKESLDEKLQNAQLVSKKLQQTAANDHAEAEFRAQLEESEKNLAKIQEKTTIQQQQHQAAMAELEGRNEQLEKKLEKLQSKLQETQDELKKSQTELQKAQKQQPDSEATTKPVKKAPAVRKRKVQETATGDFTNIEIPTPSADNATKARRATKKTVFEPSLVGEKSTFSITPFLTRSKSMGANEDASNADEEVLEDSILGGQVELAEPMTTEPEDPSSAALTKSEPAATRLPVAEKPLVVPKARGRPKKILGDAASAKKNALTQKVPKKALKSKKTVETIPEVQESEVHENSIEAEDREPAEKQPTVKFNLDPPQGESDTSNVNEEAPKKKKRKVLGSTKSVFDEDDAGGETPAAKKPTKLHPGIKRVKATLGTQKSAFGGGNATFSPLKRDRRGVGASFLG
ncbi:hypothetical protein GGS21DRAFT_211569 [Xylaria nigripes]|nr:hypothetical protein GGS21DRAFT_211569 [Xylaria nigripes]